MAGPVPAIHVFLGPLKRKTWMPGTRPGMTNKGGQVFFFTASAKLAFAEPGFSGCCWL